MKSIQFKPPKPGEKIVVSKTQVYAVVLEFSRIVRHQRGTPVFHVLADRKGRSQELEVVRLFDGKLAPAIGGTFRASIGGTA